jgi:nucleoside-diphosphate-sugar epimerase
MFQRREQSCTLERRTRARGETATMEMLITGGTGFVGRHLARRLIADGHQVRVLGRNFGAVQDLIAAGATPIAADLRDAKAVITACKGAEVVFHVGAMSEPWGRRRDFFAINVGGTQAVIAGCKLHHVRRLVYVSSPSVVFDGRDQIDASESVPYPAHFASVYSLTKKHGEDLVNAAHQGERLETVILRPKAIFGPGDRALVPRLIAAARRQRLPLIGTGRNAVDVTYVENVAHALALAASAPAADGHTYTITNGAHPLLWEVIGDVLAELGLPPIRRQISLDTALALAGMLEAVSVLTQREPVLTRYTVTILARTQTYDLRAAERDLNYAPVVSLSDGIARTLADLHP